MNESGKQKVIIGGGIVAAIAVVCGFYFWPTSDTAPPLPPTPAAEPAVEAAPNYPVPAPKADGAPALPALDESDSLLTDLTGQLFGADAVQSLLVNTDVIRHVVVTIDNLPRKKVAERLKPIKPIPGKFAVIGPEGAQTIAKENSARYSAAVRAINAMDTQAVATAYFRVYPLLQQAYVDLGYPNGYFNNRLVEVIDHLLATPTVQAPVQLTQPNVFYEFADPQLEALSAGQKALIRIGPENAATIKKKLRELRAAVTAKGPQ